MYLFSEIKYEINDIEVERIKNPGQTTTILGLASYPDDYSSSSALKLCWTKDTTKNADSHEFNVIPAGQIPAGGVRPTKNPNYNQGFAIRKAYLMSPDNDRDKGCFEFVIPFNHIFGFGNYNHTIWGVKQALTFTRCNNDLAIFRANTVDDGKVRFDQIIWKIPQIRIESTKVLELRSNLFNKEEILMAFSSRNAESFNVERDVKEFSYTITRSSGIKKPRQIFVAFQVDKKADQTKNPAVFDHITLRKAILTLNGNRYPAFDYLTDYKKNQYGNLYEWFDNFESDFNNLNPFIVGSQVNYPAFKTLYPIIRFDITHQSDTIKSGVVVDIQLDFTTEDDTPANTKGFIVILYDKVVKLTPLSEKASEVAI